MYLKNSKTVAVKIGSSLLIDDNMKIRTKWLVEFSKDIKKLSEQGKKIIICLLYTSPSPRDKRQSRMPSSA